jgi:hypothetical protein
MFSRMGAGCKSMRSKRFSRLGNNSACSINYY